MTASRLAALLDQATGTLEHVQGEGIYIASESDARLIALAPDMARLLVDMALAFEAEREQPGYLTDWHDELCSDKDDPEPCGACELLARFAEIERRAAQ